MTNQQWHLSKPYALNYVPGCQGVQSSASGQGRACLVGAGAVAAPAAQRRAGVAAAPSRGEWDRLVGGLGGGGGGGGGWGGERPRRGRCLVCQSCPRCGCRNSCCCSASVMRVNASPTAQTPLPFGWSIPYSASVLRSHLRLRLRLRADARTHAQLHGSVVGTAPHALTRCASPAAPRRAAPAPPLWSVRLVRCRARAKTRARRPLPGCGAPRAGGEPVWLAAGAAGGGQPAPAPAPA